ncbi:hypothetical protein [Flavitalea sp.]|nr:hypothetical protein [Flavitalea sp.]
MKIGNWEVNGSAIEWKGSGRNRFVIEKKSLTEKIETDDENLSLYKWIVLATDEEWLTEDDLYDLNFAFVYAAAEGKAGFDYQMFDETLSYQYNQLEEEDDEDEEDDDDDKDGDGDAPTGGKLAELKQQ